MGVSTASCATAAGDAHRGSIGDRAARRRRARRPTSRGRPPQPLGSRRRRRPGRRRDAVADDHVDLRATRVQEGRVLVAAVPRPRSLTAAAPATSSSKRARGAGRACRTARRSRPRPRPRRRRGTARARGVRRTARRSDHRGHSPRVGARTGTLSRSCAGPRPDAIGQVDQADAVLRGGAERADLPVRALEREPQRRVGAQVVPASRPRDRGPAPVLPAVMVRSALGEQLRGSRAQLLASDLEPVEQRAGCRRASPVGCGACWTSARTRAGDLRTPVRPRRCRAPGCTPRPPRCGRRSPAGTGPGRPPPSCTPGRCGSPRRSTPRASPVRRPARGSARAPAWAPAHRAAPRTRRRTAAGPGARSPAGTATRRVPGCSRQSPADQRPLGVVRARPPGTQRRAPSHRSSPAAARNRTSTVRPAPCGAASRRPLRVGHRDEARTPPPGRPGR